ncbi:MAG: hypothetical protein LBJ67_04980 [Planctomycetaceae bacterium]|nr:hypothetical protein [Planctomycetaceae bacterium]
MNDLLSTIENLPVGVSGLPVEYVKTEFDRFSQLVKSRNVTRKPGEKLPRATETRPYRFCVQDVVMAIWTMAHRKDQEDIFVEVFLSSEVYEKETRQTGFYDKFAGATAALLMILSEAYRVGIPLRISFGKTVEKGRIPFDVIRLALKNNIFLRNIPEGKINPDEGRGLYLALTGFSKEFRNKIDELHKQGLMSGERVAYTIHHGIWSLEEVEGIITCSPYPDLVLSGDAVPEYHHFYKHVITQSRMALLGGLLDRTLLNRDDTVDERVKTKGLDVEDDERNLTICTNSQWYSREYVLNKSQIPDKLVFPDWECVRLQLEPGQRLSVLLRPRVAISIQTHLEEDIELAASQIRNEKIDAVAIAIPFDFHDLSPEKQKHFKELAATKNVTLMICPESTKSLDQQAQKKMAASRIKKD